MNRTKIEWTDYTWNPVVGCKNKCYYCYAKKIHDRFSKTPYDKIVLHHNRLEQPLKVKKPSKIFVGSMTDLFAPWMHKSYVYYILDIVKKCPQHTFQFLTKTPSKYFDYKFPKNCWLGTTVTEGYVVGAYNKNNISFISCEPLLGDIVFNEINKLSWIIIGAMTGRYKHRDKPEYEWIKNIVKYAKKNKIPVFMKNNLSDAWGDKLIQQFPKEVT